MGSTHILFYTSFHAFQIHLHRSIISSTSYVPTSLHLGLLQSYCACTLTSYACCHVMLTAANKFATFCLQEMLINTKSRKPPEFYSVFQKLFGRRLGGYGLFSELDNARWEQKRKMFNPAFKRGYSSSSVFISFFGKANKVHAITWCTVCACVCFLFLCIYNVCIHYFVIKLNIL